MSGEDWKLVREHVVGSRLGNAEGALAVLERIEASAAAMREALEACREVVSEYAPGFSEVMVKSDAALATDAGAGLLARLREAERNEKGLRENRDYWCDRTEKAEAERDAYKANLAAHQKAMEDLVAEWDALRAEVEATRAELQTECNHKTDVIQQLHAEAKRLRAELEDESSASPPVGRCPKCGAAWYIDVGTCGCGL